VTAGGGRDRAPPSHSSTQSLVGVASNVDEDLESKRTLLKVLAETLESAPPGRGAWVQDFLEKRGTLRNEFFNVVAMDSRGFVVGSLADRKAIGTGSFASREYLQRTVKSREGDTSS
jgi:hypothetical protein